MFGLENEDINNDTPEKVVKVIKKSKEEKAAPEESKLPDDGGKENIHSNIGESLFVRELAEYIQAKSGMVFHAYNNKTMNGEALEVLRIVLKQFGIVRDKPIRVMDLKDKSGRSYVKMDLGIRM